MNKSLKGSLLVSISAISFGFLPIFAKFVYLYGFSVYNMLFFRFSIASVIIFLYLYIRKEFYIPKFNILISLILLGSIGYFSQSLLYLSSINYIPISVAVLLLYSYPPIVSLMASLLNIDKITSRIIIALFLGFIGVFLIANPSYNLNVYGITLAFSAAIVYSIYIVTSSKILKNIKGELASLFVMSSASMSFFIASLVQNEVIRFNYFALLFCIAMAMISTALAISTFFMGLRLIGPTRSSIISLLEPLTSTLLAFYIFYESFNILQLIGSAFIILSAFLVFSKK
ncbi:MAG: DMT family transporter [Thermoproteota archaeon]|jgi:drug/metabolite transporter (DMT)-like permease|nr:DMT family transporter [Thermoproteota archaeon]